MAKVSWRILLVLAASVGVAVGSLSAASAATDSWLQVGSDIDGEAAGDNSGRSVALSADGTTVAIGAPGNDGGGTTEGQVRVFKNVGGVWSQFGGDIDGEADEDASGRSVALSADGLTLAIGAIGNDGGGLNAGHVRVYRNVAGVWRQIGIDLNGEAAGDNSGISVALSADGATVAIGAPGNDGSATGAGHVRVYRNDGSVRAWAKVGTDIDGEVAGDGSGVSVALSADGATVAIGAPWNSGAGNFAGHVRVFKNVGGVWSQFGGDIDGEAADDVSGFAVALSADGATVAIGAPGNDGSATSAGHVRVFRSVGGVWSQFGGDVDGEAAADESGVVVALSADGATVAIGAIGNDGAGTRAGHVRVFRGVGGVWSQFGGDIDGEAANDETGQAVALSADGATLAAGAPGNDDGGAAAGHVRVHALPAPTFCDGLVASIVGTTGPDVIAGTAGSDVIAGLQGNDTIRGLGGDDVICGGQGDDVIYGGQGFDVLFGAQGNDQIYFADSATEMGRIDSAGGRAFAGVGNDTIYGSSRWDRMQGGPGNDRLFGFEGRDWIRAGAGADYINGGPAIDDLHGGNNNDEIIVRGSDAVRGGAGPSDTCTILPGSVPNPLISCEIRR